GRVARNVNGRVVLFADEVTDSMYRAISETNRRRDIQKAYNEKHGIIPQTIKKELHDRLDTLSDLESSGTKVKKGRKKSARDEIMELTAEERQSLSIRLEREMQEAAEALDFERAAELRDLMILARTEEDA
ncbi:MAG: UvrB/UvrC motif-containing protein, partial [Eubacteriales bacterium]|nr:UvrB/UvrC motif-containing protein [Eubacteriales bacterium]